MLTCRHVIHVVATCAQGTYAPQIFHIRLPRPTILMNTNNHAQIDKSNIQYEYVKGVYIQSLRQENTI